MNQLQLDRIVEIIDNAFGEEMPFSAGEFRGGDREMVDRILGGDGYRDYLQDQVDRQIISSYLTNAVVQGHLPERRLADFSPRIATREGRAAMSLQMLMSSVREAADLLANGGPRPLKVLKPGPDLPTYLTLVSDLKPKGDKNMT